jgi:acyl-coenzyme A thioesterase PaaI-like protein
MIDGIDTHREINHGLCGEPVSLDDGEATTRFVATDAMAVDDRGLVHGGFVFGLADHAAMLAVNDPNVVLGAADVRFTAPVTVGDEVTATACIVGEKGKKRTVESVVSVGDREVMNATFTAFVLDQHVLDG